MPRTTPCPDCQHEVPAGRWCNRCGAALGSATPVTAQGPARARPAMATAAGLLAGVVAVGIVLTGTGGRARTATDPAPTAVVLDPDTAPSRASARDRGVSTHPAGERVEVVCSNLQRHVVAVAELSTTQPGAVVDLVFGPCVVMGPEGAADPGR